MSVVTDAGLSHYHEKMKTLLNTKSNTNHTHNYAGSNTAGGGSQRSKSYIF